MTPTMVKASSFEDVLGTVLTAGMWIVCPRAFSRLKWRFGVFPWPRFVGRSCDLSLVEEIALHVSFRLISGGKLGLVRWMCVGRLSVGWPPI